MTCSRFQEVFAALKSVQPPNINNPLQSSTEKKVTEQFRTIRLLFKRLRLLFDKCNDSCQQGEFALNLIVLLFNKFYFRFRNGVHSHRKLNTIER